MPPTNFYNNQICKDSWHQAEVGGSPQLKLLPLIFKRPSADVAAHSLLDSLEVKTDLKLVPVVFDSCAALTCFTV